MKKNSDFTEFTKKCIMWDIADVAHNIEGNFYVGGHGFAHISRVLLFSYVKYWLAWKNVYA